MDASKLEETLDGWGSDEAGTARSRDKLVIKSAPHFNHKGDHESYSNSDGATLAAFLRRQRVRVTQRRTPVSSSNWQDTQLSNDDGGTDGSGNFFRCLDAEADVAFGVANDDNGLESGSLTGASLLLNGLDLL